MGRPVVFLHSSLQPSTNAGAWLSPLAPPPLPPQLLAPPVVQCNRLHDQAKTWPVEFVVVAALQPSCAVLSSSKGNFFAFGLVFKPTRNLECENSCRSDIGQAKPTLLPPASQHPPTSVKQSAALLSIIKL